MGSKMRPKIETCSQYDSMHRYLVDYGGEEGSSGLNEFEFELRACQGAKTNV